MEVLILILVALGGLIFSISIHESAHAWTANKLGDPTARMLGRISLDPRDHIDPIGTILFPLLALLGPMLGIGYLPILGWAKPTPFNPWNLKNPRRDSALISFAGPASNFLLAFLVALPTKLALIGFERHAYSFILSPQNFFSLNSFEKASVFVSYMILLNIALGIFNLIPIHPLDGFKVVGGLLPKDLYYQWEQLQRIGPILLLALIFFGGGIISQILNPPLDFLVKLLVG